MCFRVYVPWLLRDTVTNEKKSNWNIIFTSYLSIILTRTKLKGMFPLIKPCHWRQFPSQIRFDKIKESKLNQLISLISREQFVIFKQLFQSRSNYRSQTIEIISVLILKPSQTITGVHGFALVGRYWMRGENSQSIFQPFGRNYGNTNASISEIG